MSISNTRGLDELPPIITDVPRVELEQPPPPGHVAPFLQVEDVVVGTVRNNGTEDVCVNVGDDGGSCDSDSETSYTEREDADESGGGLRRDGECGDGCEGCDDEGNGSGVSGVSSGVGGVSSGGVSGVSGVSGVGGVSGGVPSSPHLHHLNYKIGDELVPVEYEKLTYNDVAKKINRDYQPSIPNQFSSALDILSSYLKGQRTIYMETMSLHRKNLNRLMLPAIVISAVCSVLLQSSFGQEGVGIHVVSGMNVCVACLIAIINYLKLDASAEAHKTTAHQYDKLLTSLEFTSGEVLLFHETELGRYAEDEVVDARSYLLGFGEDVTGKNDEELVAMAKQTFNSRMRKARTKLNDDMKSTIMGVRNQIAEIKDANQFVVPKSIRTRYPLLYNTNVFSIIKKIEDYKGYQMTKLKNIKNDIRIVTKAGLAAKHQRNKDQAASRRRVLQKRKNNTVCVILFLNTAFSMVERMFMQEIQNAELRKKHRFGFAFNNFLNSVTCVSGSQTCLPAGYVAPEKSGGELLLKILGLREDLDKDVMSRDEKELIEYLRNKGIYNMLSFDKWARIMKSEVESFTRQSVHNELSERGLMSTGSRTKRAKSGCGWFCCNNRDDVLTAEATPVSVIVDGGHRYGGDRYGGDRGGYVGGNRSGGANSSRYGSSAAKSRVEEMGVMSPSKKRRGRSSGMLMINEQNSEYEGSDCGEDGDGGEGRPDGPDTIQNVPERNAVRSYLYA